MPNKKPKTTFIFEAKIQFQGIDECLFFTLNNKEWQRMVNVLEGDPIDSRFYGTDPCEGYEVYINPRHVTKINLLSNLPGIEFAEENRNPMKNRITYAKTGKGQTLHSYSACGP